MELELSAQDHGDVRSLEFMMPNTDPYVPPMDLLACINATEWTFRLTDRDECAHNNVEDGPCNTSLPHGVAVLVPVVVEPHETHRLEHHESGEDSTNERDEAIKDWNTGTDQVSDNGDATSATQPRCPMNGSV